MRRKILRAKCSLGVKTCVTDPCYHPGEYGNFALDTVPGQYVCWAVCYPTGCEGRPYWIEEIILRHENYLTTKFARECEDAASLGVDSGQLGVFDHHYYTSVAYPNNAEAADNDWYRRCCTITCYLEGAGVMDRSGFVASSGYGDGCYGLRVARRSDGSVVGMRIRFIFDKGRYNDPKP